MSALRRVISAPWLVLALWAAPVVAAFVLGGSIHTIARAAIEPFSGPADAHRLGAIGELVSTSRATGASIVIGLAVTAGVSLLGWTLVAGWVIARLDGRSGSELASSWLRTLPSVAVTSIWHAVLRVVFLVIVFASVGPLPGPLALILLAAAVVVSALALDLARVGVVLHDAPGYHIRTAAYAFVQAVKQWRLLAAVAGPWLLQIVASLASGWIAFHSLGVGGQLWLARGLTLVAVVAGLWRVSLVVNAGRIPLRPTRDG